MNLQHVKQIADAVLYEGYILYPYRASAVKNQQRFNFGVLMPQGGSDAEKSAAEKGPGRTGPFCRNGPAGASHKLDPSPFSPGSEAWSMRTECLVEGNRPVIDVRVRCLQLVSREVFQRNANGDCRIVPSLEVGGKVFHTWQEAVEREVIAANLRVDDLAGKPHQVDFSFEANETCEALSEANDKVVGKLVRRQHLIQGIVTAGAKMGRNGLTRVAVEIHNTTPQSKKGTGPICRNGPPGASHKLDLSPFSTARDEALLQSMASTHTILGVHGGQFVSLIDPPERFAAVAAECDNVGTWPVLVGEEGERDMMLSSPIILYDYPQIAPESGGDFFDGTEIDEMLALRVMTLTDEEKREMQDVDDRARQILQRTESLPQEHWQKLHGAIRGLKTIS